MKRSRSIRLVLLGGLSAGALSGCSSSSNEPDISSSLLYTNNHYVPGAGYYHAPYRAWFPRRYNEFDLGVQMYYHGGVWTAAPHQSITNLSTPTPEAAAQALAATRTSVTRHGFGHTSRSYSTWS